MIKKYHLKESVKGWLWLGAAILFVYALLTYQAYRVDKIENNINEGEIKNGK